MTSSFTPNIALEKPASGDYVNTWATPVNTDWDILDSFAGGTTSINVVAVSGTVTLTTTQYRPRNIVFSGTISANIVYQVPSGVGGQWSVYNNSTGAFTITFASAGGGTSVVLPQGYRTLVVSDGTNIQIAFTFAWNAAGSNTQIQFNNSSALGASSLLTWDGTYLTSRGLKLSGATSGYAGFASPAIGPSVVWTLPTADGTAGQALVTNGAGTLSWATAGGGSSGVSSFSAGTTGLTPTTSTTGVVTLAGTLIPTNGGTGFTSYTAGDLIYAANATNLSKLAAVATGSVLLSGPNPSWGTVSVPAGGTGVTSLTSGALLKGNGVSAVSASIMTDNGSSIAVAGNGYFISPNTGTTGAVILQDASGDPGACYLQALNHAGNSEYGFIRFVNGSTLVANNFTPAIDITATLGNASLRWTTVYAQTGTINTSDERDKLWRGGATPAELAAAKAIVGELGFYQWRDAIAEKGANARFHFGARAQRVWSILAEHGLVEPIGSDGRPGNTPYAFLCWDEIKGSATGGRYGLRTDELMLFLLAAQEQRLALLEANR